MQQLHHAVCIILVITRAISLKARCIVMTVLPSRQICLVYVYDCIALQIGWLASLAEQFESHFVMSWSDSLMPLLPVSTFT